MKTEGCREWRTCSAPTRSGISAPRSAPGSRRTSRAAPSAGPRSSRWRPSAQLLPHADPERFSQPAPQPPPDLGSGSRPRSTPSAGTRKRRKRRALRLRLRRRRRRPPRRRCWRSSILPGGGGSEPRAARRVRLAAGRGRDRRDAGAARLRHRDPHVRERRPLRHPLPRLPARPPTATGTRPAASATAGATTPTRCSAPRSTSRARRAIGVHAGNRTFVAPVDPVGRRQLSNSNQEDAT